MDLNFENLYMPNMYKEAIERKLDSCFAIYQRIDGSRQEYSYSYISNQAIALLEKMKKAGLKKGDRIGVISSLRPWWFALHYACLLGEYIMVCIDPGVPIIQLNHMLLETEVRCVFTSLKSINLPKELDEHIPVYAIKEDFPLISNCSSVDNILLGDSNKLPKETFYILFSSGTTSENRKAVLLKHSTITKGIEYGMAKDANIYKDTSAYTIREKDLMLFPPYHIAGLLCATYDFYCGTKIIMLERLTPNGLQTIFKDIKPDNICTVPSMLTSLYKKIEGSYTKHFYTKFVINLFLYISKFMRKNFGIKAGLFLLQSINSQAFGGNMKGFMIGASPIDEKTNSFFLDMGIDVSMAYGLTELGAPLATTGQGYYPATAGRVLRHTNLIDIRITNKDENGRGEVEVLSPYRMISYINPKDNEGCFTEDGYFKTGDLGYFDSNDCLVICGRIKESIVLKNGEKLLPEEIEDKYQNLNCVKEVAAFKVPGKGGCDDFAIAIIKDKTKGIPDEAMKARVYERAEHLPTMYKPKDVYVVKEFPLSSSHKIQRFRLTQMVINGDNEPKTDALQIPIDDDATVSRLRKVLIEVVGEEWKTRKLTQGTLLNIDSLTTVDLYVAIQNEWNIDLFQSSVQPDTIGGLLDIIRNFDVVDKNNKKDLDLAKYPLPMSKIGKIAYSQIEKLVKQMWHVRGYGQSNIPNNTNFLLCSNHRTDIDPGFICSCLPTAITEKTCIIGKADIIENKLFKGFAISHNYIPIDRTGNSIQTLDRSRELLLQGWNILIFPEGTSVQNHTKLYPLKDGAAKLSIATNKPIVPVYITGVAHVDKEMNSFSLPPLRSRIRVKFGKPIYPKNMTVKELNDLLSKKIEELN